MYITKEEIKHIENEGYIISEDGNIYKHGKKVKKNITNNKYTVSLSVNAWTKTFYLSHLIVSKYLSQPPKNFKVVRYRDDNFKNTRINNLFWSDGKYSVRFYNKRENMIFDSAKQAANFFNVSQSCVNNWIKRGKTGNNREYKVVSLNNVKE